MKALIASLTALGLVAVPVAAQTTNTMSPANSKSSKAAIAKQAKAEHESAAKETQEHRAAARHHAKRHHAKRHHAKHAMAHKTSKMTKTGTTAKKTS